MDEIHQSVFHAFNRITQGIRSHLKDAYKTLQHHVKSLIFFFRKFTEKKVQQQQKNDDLMLILEKCLMK